MLSAVVNTLLPGWLLLNVLSIGPAVATGVYGLTVNHYARSGSWT